MSTVPAGPTSIGQLSSNRSYPGHRIAATIAAFAVELQQSADDRPQLLDYIAHRAVEIIPGADAAALVGPGEGGRLRNHASSGGGLPQSVTALENAYGEGPDRDVIDSGEQVRSGNVEPDGRWRRFGPAAAGAGVLSMLSTPITVAHRPRGSLSLIGTGRRFDEDSAAYARILTAHAAIALSASLRRESLLVALNSRDLIGQAKGILMERLKLDPDAAFAALVNASADNNMKLRVVCEVLCRTGVLVPRKRRR